jgi:hypothetical protein
MTALSAAALDASRPAARSPQPAARSPLLDDLAERPELLAEIRDRTSHNPGRSGVEQLARTMADMGVLSALPFAARLTRDEWLARSRAGDLDVPDLWLDYAQRWFQTSTLTRSSRSQTYFALIKLGRWINHEQPDHADPGSWTRELAAGWVARVDRMLVGEYSHGPNIAYMRRRSCGELLPRTKAHLIWPIMSCESRSDSLSESSTTLAARGVNGT